MIRRWGGVVVSILLVAGWLAFLRPVALGGATSYILVDGNSMLPTLRPGDLALTRAGDTYREGDVVTFRVPEGELGAGVKVIHRIVGGDAATGFVLRGDNKAGPDPWRPTGKDIVGRMWLHVPAAGRVLEALREPPAFAMLATLLAVWILLGSRPAEDRTAADRGGGEPDRRGTERSPS